MRLLLVRHGESEGNASGIVQGRLDYGLTELGRQQAAQVAEYLAREPVDHLVSSPLKRAWQTAEAIGERLGVMPRAEPDLQEYDVGAISGLSGPQIREKFPEVIAQFQKGLRPDFPGAEGRDVFHARVRALIDRLTEQDQTTVAVAHGGVVGAVCYYVLGLDVTRRGMFETANCAVTEITRDRVGRLVLSRANDTCHLEGLVTVADRG